MKESKGFRDAVHVPFIMVTCGVMVQPGRKVSLRHDDGCVPWTGNRDLTMWHGVADPFREEPIEPGEVFAVYIRKECFTNLTHNFEIEVHDRGGTDFCHSVCEIF